MGTADLDEMAAEARLSEEKAARSMVDAARLAEELRMEQDTATGLERERKVLEAQVKDLQSRCDEAEMNALKGGKKLCTKWNHVFVNLNLKWMLKADEWEMLKRTFVSLREPLK